MILVYYTEHMFLFLLYTTKPSISDSDWQVNFLFWDTINVESKCLAQVHNRNDYNWMQTPGLSHTPDKLTKEHPCWDEYPVRLLIKGLRLNHSGGVLRHTLHRFYNHTYSVFLPTVHVIFDYTVLRTLCLASFELTLEISLRLKR